MRFTLIFLFTFTLFSQSDEKVISSIFSKALTESKSYNWLDHLSNQIGGRLSGSLEAQKAVEWSKDCLLYTSPSPRDLSSSRMPSSA